MTQILIPALIFAGLGIFAGLLGAKFGFSVAEPARHIRHLAERPDKRARQEGRRNERQA